MIGRALDSNNNLIIESGKIKLVEDGAEVVQKVRSNLLFYLGEWFLDTTKGVPYFEQVFIKPVNLANVESIFKSAIINTTGVARLINFAMDFEGGKSRKLSLAFEAETIYDEIIKSEVTING